MSTELCRRLTGRKSCCRISYTSWLITTTARSQIKALILLSLSSKLARGGTIALCAVLLATAGCRTHRNDPTKSSPEVLYKKAHKSLDSYDFQAAIKQYEALTARFPFTDQARQARL